jgi:peptidoglycan-N-acetylglucosamine deacetylase
VKNKPNRWVLLAALLLGALLVWDLVLQAPPLAAKTVAQKLAIQTRQNPNSTETAKPTTAAPKAAPEISTDPPSQTLLKPNETSQKQVYRSGSTDKVTDKTTDKADKAKPRSPNFNPTPNTWVSVSGRRGLILRRLPEATPSVALTFDDGPNPGYTEPVLAILQRYRVRATFFLVGREVARHPALAQQIVQAGHVIGNHTHNHRTAYSSPEAARAEIEAAAKAMLEATGQETRLFRPPGGRLNNGLADFALAQGYTVVSWSVQSNDWNQNTAKAIEQNVLESVQPGAIILLHDGGGDRSQTVAALPAIIEGLQTRGYSFRTVSEMVQKALE